MSELSEIFGTPQEDGMEPDFNAIFGGEAADAPPIPVEEPKSTDIPATETLAPDVPAAEARSDESAAASAEEMAKSVTTKTTEKAKSKTKEPEAEPDLFAAFNDQGDAPEPPAQGTVLAASPRGTGLAL